MTVTDEHPSPEPDHVFSALADTQRRRLLDTLVEQTDSVPVEQLTATVAAQEASERPGETDEVRLTLAHVHLPLLSDYGMIERANGRVRLTERGATVEPFLTIAKKHETGSGSTAVEREGRE